MSPRQHCPGCGRVAVDCLCPAVRSEPTRVVVGVLQHPREARVSKSTGSLLPLAWSNAFLLRGIDLDQGGELATRLAAFPAGAVGLLFPDDGAPIVEAPSGLACLLVPDGSWTQAATILRATRSLHMLPRFALPPGLRGDYPIRKPQGPGRLSTLEAAVAALRLLEGDPCAYQAALDLQAALVAQGLEHLRAGGARHPALGTGRWRGRGASKEGV
jgi:DTW domain-containing protein YfiP